MQLKINEDKTNTSEHAHDTPSTALRLGRHIGYYMVTAHSSSERGSENKNDYHKIH
jgi:hypothetical protein